MYNSRLIAPGFCGVLVAVLSSCALPQQSLFHYWQGMRHKQSAPLLSGMKYEVRKAVASNLPFHPSEIKRYTFVFKAPKPPLLVASNLHRSSQMRVRTTAYTHTESDHLIYGVKNAVGTHLKFGSVRSAAADWSRFPVGTQFRIAGQPDVVYEVDDYGSALVGTGTIDLYKPSRALMNNWGVRNVDIEVIHWGSYEKSMELMRDRTQWRHVRTMLEGIEARLRPGTRSSFTAAL